MARSIWKIPFVDLNIIRRFDELVLEALNEFTTNSIFEEEITRKFLKRNKLEVTMIAQRLSDEDPIEVWSRRSVISPEFLGFSFLIYNGRILHKVKVKKDMLGKKFGEFAVSKRVGPKIHFPNLKKKKKKNKDEKS